MALTPTRLSLHTTPFCGASARIRTAALLKGIRLEQIVTNSKASGFPAFVSKYKHHISHRAPPNYGIHNPIKQKSFTRPIVIADYSNGQSILLTQPLSMLLFLEDSYPGRSLLPPVTDMRARVRALDIASATTTELIFEAERMLCVKDAETLDSQWAEDRIVNALNSIEELLELHWTSQSREKNESHRRFCVREEASIADVCLWPLAQTITIAATKVNYSDYGLERVAAVFSTLNEIREFRENGLEHEL